MIPAVSFINLMFVAAIAFGVPLLLGLAPRLALPATVLEIVAGIALGPSGLGLVAIDTPIQILALIGVTFVLFLAGMEIDPARLRGRALRVAVGGALLSFGLALLLSYGLGAAGLIAAPLFIAIVLSATALPLVLPALVDSGQLGTPFGQVVVIASTIADFGTVLLLSLLYSRETTSTGTRVVLLGCLGALALAVVLALLRTERSPRISGLLQKLQGGSTQIRVRGALLLLTIFVVCAERFGLETVLGAFIAGMVLRVVDPHGPVAHPRFQPKLEAIGYGVFVPIFFISSGLRFNLRALLDTPGALALVPLALAALLIVRATPAALYLPLLGPRRSAAAGLLQTTTLLFVVVAMEIGGELGIVDPATSAAFVAAAMLSVLICPLAALTLLRQAAPAPAEARPTNERSDSHDYAPRTYRP